MRLDLPMFSYEETKNEVWADIEGYGDRYRISSLGRILSYCGITDRMLKPRLNNYGKLTIMLTRKDKKPKVELIGILVAKAFVPNPNNYRYVDYIDGDMTNCRADNLVWVKLTGSQIKQYKSQSKPINQYTPDGTLVKSYQSAKEVAELLDVPKSTITSACYYRTKLQGYIWIYADDSFNTTVERPRSRKYPKKVNQLDIHTDTVIKKFDSLTEAAKSLGNVEISNLVHCCKGRHKTAYGYRWEYAD